MAVSLRSALRIVTVVVITLIAYAAISAVSYVASWSAAGSARADAIVVMGAAQYDGTPSEMLRQRLQHALDVWNQGRAPLIAVTGGKLSGDRFTEAQTGRRWLTDRGVPASSIVSEDIGHSTWQSLSELAPVLRARSVTSVIVVSSYWHVQRAQLSLRDLGFDVSASAATTNADTSWRRSVVPREWFGILVGRLLGFEALYRITG